MYFRTTQPKSSLKYVIILPSFIRIVPIPIPEALQSISKDFSNFSQASKGAWFNFTLSKWKVFSCFFPHLNPTFSLITSITDVPMVLNPFTNLLQKLASPWKLHTLLTLDGLDYSRIAQIFSLSTCIPCVLIAKSRNTTLST